MSHFTLTLLAWSARAFGVERHNAIQFAKDGNREAARRWGEYARQSYATIHKILNQTEPTKP
jgi:hypothetical protein